MAQKRKPRTTPILCIKCPECGAVFSKQWLNNIDTNEFKIMLADRIRVASKKGFDIEVLPQKKVPPLHWCGHFTRRAIKFLREG